MKKRAISILLSLVMILSAVPQLMLFASAEAGKSGKCGENLTYAVDSEGTLTVSGTGAMYDYGNPKAPWRDLSDSIKKVIIEENVTTIGNEAFSCCDSINCVEIPGSVVKIGESAFVACSFEHITIPDSVTEMGDRVFEGCQKLIDIDLSCNLKNIPDFTFNRCDKLQKIDIPDGVTKISSDAFSECFGLKEVKIPDSVEVIDDCAFLMCDELEDLKLPSNLKKIGTGAFAYNFKLADIVIPGSVTEIGDYAFVSCPLIKQVYIPGTVKTIGKCAFGYRKNMISREESKIEDFVIEGENNSAASKYAEDNGFIFNSVCKHSHTQNFAEQPSTYLKNGYTAGTYCNDCKMWIKGHEVLPKLEATEEIKNEENNISLKHDGNAIKTDVKLNVQKLTEGKAADIVREAKRYHMNQIFDIILTCGGSNVQPEGFVLVGIPLPEKYNAEKTAVYHVSQDEGSLEKMNSYVADGIIWFETDHFSAYVMVDESAKEIPEGDIDGDGSITAYDARLVLRKSVSLEELDADQLQAADVDGEKGITASDARMILRRSVGIN